MPILPAGVVRHNRAELPNVFVRVANGEHAITLVDHLLQSEGEEPHATSVLSDLR
jgi:hypothetical protein